MSEIKFRPEIWSADILRGVLASQEAMLGPKERRRKGHLDRTPYTDAELQARAEAVATWEQLTRELMDKGWLEHEACYECGGELKGATMSIKTLVFAGNGLQAQRWATATQTPPTEYIYISDDRALMGRATTNMPRVFIGSFHNRRDAHDILDRLRIADLAVRPIE